MVFVDQPVALLGSVDSPSTHLAEQIAAKANLPLVSPVTTDPSVTLAGVSWMFCCAPSDDAIARVLVDDILAGPSGKSEIRNPKSEISRPLALLAGTDHESRMTARAVLRELNRRHRPPDFRFDVPPGPGTLDTHWTALAAAAPSAVLIIAGPDDAARLLRAARTRLPASRPCQFYGTHVMARTRFRELAGDAAKGVRFPVLAAPDPRHPATAQFMRRFTAQRQHLPDDTAVLTYDATCLLLEAIRKAGPSRAAVRETLAHSGPWHGLGGIIQFDGTGQNTRTNVTMAALHEPGSLGRRLSPQPFVAGATKGCGRFMVPRRASRSVESLHEPTVAGRARHSVRAAAGCNVDCIRGAQGTARPTVGQRFMVFMRDNCFAINPLPQPAIRNAGFIRQNRAADRTLPDESSVLHTPRFGTPTDDLPFGVSTFPLGGLVPAPFRESRPEPNVGQPHTS
jgi:branched-chain amino acid transport system substrate-binding protein